MNQKRIEEIDSLRGIAALIVLFYHCLRIFPSLDSDEPYRDHGFFISLIKETPLRLFWSGHESVVLFFIISGFVLSIPVFNGQKLNYSSYIIKRVCRLYIPYIVSVIIAVILSLTLSKGGINGYSHWFNKIWTEKTSSSLLINHFFMIGEYNSNSYNTVIWSLVHEMRISIVFPFIALFVMRVNWKYSFVSSLACGISFFILTRFIPITSNTSFLYSIHYCAMFIIGAILAKHKDELVYFFSRLNKKIKVIMLIFALVAYTYPGLFPKLFFHRLLTDDWITSLGCAIFILAALSYSKFSLFLKTSTLQWLGKVSYSLYLYHTIILFSFVYLFNDTLPISVILFMTILTSLAVASLAYKWIEEPSIKLGKHLSRKLIKSYSSETKRVSG
jgi:peptidoglycan/LPS O-acetylase OafA/YrhL